jgi:hypothetical protein
MDRGPDQEVLPTLDLRRRARSATELYRKPERVEEGDAEQVRGIPSGEADLITIASDGRTSMRSASG